MKKRYPALPWILGGDFNMTKSLMEKKGGTRTLGRDSVAFQNFITNMKLVDMETSNGILLGPHNTIDYPITIVFVPLINIVEPLLSPYCYYCAP